MKLRQVFPAVLLLVALVLSTGCTGTNGGTTPVPTTTATPVPTTPVVTTPSPTVTPTATTAPPTPEPTVTLPSELETNIGITWDDVYRTIFVTYNGGKRQILLQVVEAKVTTPSGSVLRKELRSDGAQIPVGATLEFRGERGANRVEVRVTINGVTYKIRDETVFFR